MYSRCRRRFAGVASSCLDDNPDGAGRSRVTDYIKGVPLVNFVHDEEIIFTSITNQLKAH